MTTIDCKLSSGKNSISVTIPSNPPLLLGSLWRPVRAMKVDTTMEARTLTVTLEKTEAGSWPIPVGNAEEETDGLDPKSGCVLGSIVMQTAAGKDNNQGIEMVQGSANTGFLPALQALGQMYIGKAETFELGVKTLAVAIDLYDDVESMARLGSVIVMGGDPDGKGMELLERASGSGVESAKLMLGQVYSPVGNVPVSVAKDAPRAMKLLSECVGHDVVKMQGLFGMAKILIQGAEGVPQDKTRAERLYKEAKEIAAKMRLTLENLETQ